jgi:hypothetical protein
MSELKNIVTWGMTAMHNPSSAMDTDDRGYYGDIISMYARYYTEWNEDYESILVMHPLIEGITEAVCKREINNHLAFELYDLQCKLASKKLDLPPIERQECTLPWNGEKRDVYRPLLSRELLKKGDGCASIIFLRMLEEHAGMLEGLAVLYLTISHTISFCVTMGSFIGRQSIEDRSDEMDRFPIVMYDILYSVSRVDRAMAYPQSHFLLHLSGSFIPIEFANVAVRAFIDHFPCYRKDSDGPPCIEYWRPLGVSYQPHTSELSRVISRIV